MYEYVYLDVRLQQQPAHLLKSKIFFLLIEDKIK